MIGKDERLTVMTPTYHADLGSNQLFNLVIITHVSL